MVWPHWAAQVSNSVATAVSDLAGHALSWYSRPLCLVPIQACYQALPVQHVGDRGSRGKKSFPDASLAFDPSAHRKELNRDDLPVQASAHTHNLKSEAGKV